jgi:hypothetical protein
MRGVFTGVSRILETLKTRGFNSGNVLPVRQPL